MVCAKFAWNWQSGSGEEDENVKSLRQRQQRQRRTTDIFRSEKFTWAFGSSDSELKSSGWHGNVQSSFPWFPSMLPVSDIIKRNNPCHFQSSVLGLWFLFKVRIQTNVNLYWISCLIKNIIRVQVMARIWNAYCIWIEIMSWARNKCRHNFFHAKNFACPKYPP